MKLLKNEQLPEFLERLDSKASIYLPQKEEGINTFRRYPGGGKASDLLEALGGTGSVLSPKDLFFPQTEGLFSFRGAENEFAIDEVGGPAGEERVIFGIRSCDLRSLEVLDHVFAGGEFEDANYKLRRERTILVAWSCIDPQETCFCTAFDIDPGRPKADIRLTNLGDALAVEEASEKGTKLLAEAGDLLSDASREDVDRARLLMLEARDRVELQPPVTNIDQSLKGMFNDPIFEEFAGQCLSCGICTYLCPTCHCYDLASDSVLGQGVRLRCWDSCMFAQFTLLAGGENPRPRRQERLKNRFLHKLRYFPERYGTFACTGCGRCLRHCPAAVDITAFIDRVKGVKAGD